MPNNDELVEWVLLGTNLTTRLAILPVSTSHLYIENNEPGSGELKIPLDSVAAALVTSGMFVQCNYRGAARGGFFIDFIKRDEADADENGGRWMSISGRGPLALLDDAIVWDDGTANTTRDFTAKTMADIMLTLIAEAVARGGLLLLSDDFSPTLDSNSVAWTDSDDYTFNVGTSLLDVLRQFTTSGGIEFSIALSGGSFVLSAYKAEHGTDKTATIYLRVGTNCEEVNFDERGDELKNVARVQYQNGYITQSDPTSIAARRRREKLVNASVAPTATLAAIIGSADVERYKNPRTSIALKVYDGISPNFFIDYNLGDYVTLDVLGTETAYRVLGVQMDFGETEFASIVIEMNTIFYENDIRQQQNIDFLLNQLNTLKDAGAGGGVLINQWFGLTHEGDGASVARVNVIATDPTDTYMYIGGRFTTFGGLDAPYIVRMNLKTREYSTVGDAVLSNDVNDIAFDSLGNVFLVGNFTNVGGVTTSDRIIKLNVITNQYTGILGGFLFGINRIYIVGDHLYALENGTYRIYHYLIASDTWDALHAHITSALHDRTAIWSLGGSGDYLYAGGQNLELTAISGQEGILRYQISTTTWTSLTGTIGAIGGGRVERILVSGDYVYVCGSFSVSDTLVFRYKLSTPQWQDMGLFHDPATSPNMFAGALGLDADGNILVGSYDPDNLAYALVTRFNLTSLEWEDLGGAFNADNGVINSFALYDDNVYAGGGNSSVEGTTPGMFQVYIPDLLNALEFLQQEIINSQHPRVSIGTPANGLSITANQVLSLALAGAATIGAVSASAQTFAGVKTFSSDPLIPDEAYDATAWNGSLEPPTKNAIRDKIETMPTVNGHAIKEEGGAALTQRANLNFIGASVTATDNAGTNATDVTITVSSTVLVMATGVTNPPVPVQNAEGTDWIYAT